MGRIRISLILISAAMLVSFIVAGANIRKIKEIESTIPKYLPRKGKLWERQSRIVGELKKAPENFTIEMRQLSTGEPLKTLNFKNTLYVYETEMVPPGKYFVTVRSDGYDPLKLKSVELKAGTDCLIDIVFGTVEYNRY